MPIYKPGDKSKALCPTCGIVSTTFKNRNITIQNKQLLNVLVGVCDKCSTTVSLPAQITPIVKQALKIKSKYK